MNACRRQLLDSHSYDYFDRPPYPFVYFASLLYIFMYGYMLCRASPLGCSRVAPVLLAHRLESFVPSSPCQPRFRSWPLALLSVSFHVFTLGVQRCFLWCCAASGVVEVVAFVSWWVAHFARLPSFRSCCLSRLHLASSLSCALRHCAESSAPLAHTAPAGERPTRSATCSCSYGASVFLRFQTTPNVCEPADASQSAGCCWDPHSRRQRRRSPLRIPRSGRFLQTCMLRSHRRWFC